LVSEKETQFEKRTINYESPDEMKNALFFFFFSDEGEMMFNRSGDTN